jgi:hypothetical protein
MLSTVNFQSLPNILSQPEPTADTNTTTDNFGALS